MSTLPLVARLNQFVERESLRPDLNRATRATTAVLVPLILGRLGHLPVETAYAVLVAQNLAMVDVRGAYSLRFILLLSMTAILAASAGLGELVAPHLVVAVLAMGGIALLGGLWRHLSTDYGPSIAIASTLIFAIGLSGHGNAAVAGQHVLASFAGGLWGLVLQVGLWPLRAQHPLRRTVADCWLALADLFGAMATDDEASASVRHNRIAEAEALLRSTLDQTFVVLNSTAATRQGGVGRHLHDLTRAAAELADLVDALNTALEAVMERPEYAQIGPAFPPVLTALANTSRTVALAVVSRQPAHLATFDLRVHRLTNLLSVVQSRGAQPSESEASARLGDIIARLSRHLPVVGAALRSTIDRANEHAAFSLELFDLETWKLRPLAAALNLSPRLDPAVVRYALRSAVLTMIGVVAYKTLALHHGYWLPFTMMVVLQPDYGATRQKAAQRMLGTIAGAILASAILWLKLPIAVILTATAATSFAFTYYLKRNYGIAVIFITLFVVLLTETSGTVNFLFAVERLASTLAGGLLAVAAAFVFWPVWERDRLPGILAEAFRANRTYLQRLGGQLAAGQVPDAATRKAQRQAEAANSAAFSSLRRMSGDPKNRQETLVQAAALANGNQRLTRTLNLLALHLQSAPGPQPHPGAGAFVRWGVAALDGLAEATVGSSPDRAAFASIRAGLDQIHATAAAGAGPRPSWTDGQIGRAATELSAMLLA